MISPEVAQRRAADHWFLDRRLPAVLRPGALVRRVWPRSAPALAAFAVLMLNSAVVVLVSGKHTINIEGQPTRTEWFVLALLVFVLPIAATVGWLVSRISTVRGRTTEALRRPEQLNVMFVLAASQLTQILVVAVLTASIFFVLGLIVLSPELLAAWTRNGSSDGTFLGMTIPVPQALIQITMFLGALTFMYVSAKAVTDRQYRAQFLDAVTDDLRLTLIARNRYRAAVSAR